MPRHRHLVQKAARRIGIHPNTRAIILGHQKTGTSAIASLLALMTGASYSQDPFYHVDMGAAEVLRKTTIWPEHLALAARQHPHLFRSQIVKDPDFIYFFEQLKPVYPSAKFVFVARRPEDMIRSIVGRLGLTVEALEKPAEALRDQLPNQHWFAVLGGLGDRQSTPSESGESATPPSAIWTLLKRWTECNQCFFENERAMHLIRYEDFNQDKLSTIQELAAYLKMPARHDISDSINRQFQPSGRSRAGKITLTNFATASELLPTVTNQLQTLGYVDTHHD